MKKLIVLVFALAFASLAYAEEESFMPQKGDFNTEVQFNPFGSSIFGNSGFTDSGNEGVFQGAYFLSNKDVLTFEVGLNGVNMKEVNYGYYDEPDGWL